MNLKLGTIVNNNVSILFINCNKCTTLMQVLIIGETGDARRVRRWQWGGYMGLYVLSAQLFCNSKTVLKKSLLIIFFKFFFLLKALKVNPVLQGFYYLQKGKERS